jgi:DNA ligase-1
MLKNFRPMKPCKITEKDLDNLTYPVIVQSKLDGFRCVLLEGKALSYSLKPIRNVYTRTKLEEYFGKHYKVIDGELLLKKENTFQDIQSAFNSVEGEPKFEYYTFDCFQNGPTQSFMDRHALFFADEDDNDYIKNTTNIWCYNKEDVLNHEKQVLDWGYEGIIIRKPFDPSPYKFGRSTLKEGYLLALKRFTDAEAEILGAYPLQRNLNVAEINEHGLTERSSAQANKYDDNLLGGLMVRGINGQFKGVEFNIGTGFTEKQRIDLWQNYTRYGKIVKYKYQSVGSKDKPRLPVFLGFRHEDDL